MKHPNTKSAVITTSALLIVMSAMGCSAKISGGSPDVPIGFPTLPPVDNSFKDEIPGPSINGVWKSGCVASWRNDGQYQYITFNISGRNVSRQVELFSDPSCTAAAQTTVEQGLFRYDSKLPDGTFNIEYQFNMPNGTYTQYENILLQGSQTMLISDEIGGTAEATIPTTLSGAPTPIPSATPSEGPTPAPAPIHAGNHVAKIGDTAAYVGQADGAIQTENYTNQGYDATQNQWTVFENIQGPNPETGYEYYASLWSSTQTLNMFATCLTQGGQLQTVTVAAGTFDTCLLDDGTDQVWYGDAPVLGIVKLQRDDGSYSTSLQSYSWADASN